MPSVGMRRSTRVFVPKSSVLKDDGEARVLRSGKRLWSFSSDAKAGRESENEWFPMGNSSVDDDDDADDVPLCKSNGFRKIVQKRSLAVKRFRRKVDSPESMEDSSNGNKMFGTGYGRKKPRLLTSNTSSQSENRVWEDRMYGIQYVRQQVRKKRAAVVSSLTDFSSLVEISEVNSEFQVLAGKPSSDLGEKEESLSLVHRAMLDVFVEPSHDSARLFANFFVSVMNFMRRSKVGLSELAGFVCCEPIASVFSQHGVRFSDLSCRISLENSVFLSGNCQIFGARQFVPLFSLNFSAVPLSFMSLHFRIFLRSQHILYALLRYLMGLLKDDYRIVSRERLSNEIDLSFNKAITSGSPLMKRREVNFVNRSFGLGGRSASTRLNLNSRNIRKRSSLRSVRVRRPSSMCFRNGQRHSNGFNFIKLKLTGDNKGGEEDDGLLGMGNGSTSFSILESDNKHKKLLRHGLSGNGFLEPNQNMDSVSCCANLLVVEPDKCYREAGAMIMMEFSSSNDWCLAVKVRGVNRYMLTARGVMRPSTPNRFTHAMTWMYKNGWKLEFPNRRDWFTFKELYRECSDRNIYGAYVREVPIPGVHEVPDHGDFEYDPFERPNAYIRMHDDEVARALLRRTANYEVDSGDEEWLEKLNNSLCNGDDGPQSLVSNDNFEEMIDVFEKTSYCTPDDVSDENRAVRLCSDLKTDIVAAVYQYWVNKRELKDSTLLRVFQSAPPPRRVPQWQKPFFRKRRSFKRQASKYGRGYKRTFLQAFAEEQDQDAKRRVEEAKTSASISVDLAILKRKRAQTLMENAELATYKANLALKIAEAAKFVVSSDAFVSFIIGYDSKSVEN